MGKRVTAKVEGGEELVRRLEKMGLNVTQVLAAAAQAGAQVIADTANGMAPSPAVLIEGNTKSSSKNRITLDIGPSEEKWYWRFLETGVVAHGISPRSKKALAFEVDGERVLAWAVSHPGVAAKPFLRPAFDREKDNATKAVGENIKQVTQ